MLVDAALGGALSLADLVLRALPAPLAYGVADLAGRAWYRLAPARRALVTENLRRVAAATGRPTDPRSLRRLVRRAFVEHARYYLEVLRAPHYPPERIDQIVSIQDEERWMAVLRHGVVVAIPHFGNFDPYGTFVTERGVRAVAPVAEIRPRALFRFLLARRGSGRIRMIPLARARRPMLEALKRHEVVALAADRDLRGDGVPVTFFGLPTTMPPGPASLALIGDVPLIVAACRRVGPDRFVARGWPVEVARTGDRQRDIPALTQAIAVRLEEAIAEAPEQWWGAFQPIWLDQRRSR